MRCNQQFAGFAALTVFVLALLLTTAPLAIASAEQITMEYYFEQPQILDVNIGSDWYHRTVMEDAPNYGNTNKPLLPARGTRILLPYGTEVSSVEVISGEKILLGSDFLIEPKARPIRLSADPSEYEPPIPDANIYSSNRPFPESAFADLGTQSFRGYQILTVRLHPVQYIPTSGELFYYPDMTIIVNTVDADRTESLFRGLVEDEELVKMKVDNPEMIDSYNAAGIRGSKSYDLLIITTTSLAGSFQELKDYHDTTGILTEIRTTNDVGSADPDDVRNYITNRYNDDGIQWVLIGADDDIIPAKDLYVKTSPGGSTEYNMPGDLYFGCLDGTYNFDGDSYWGEPNDGIGGGDVDLVAEVYVGRAAVGNTTEADRFVSKTIEYLNCTDPYLQNILLVGEYLGFGGDSEYAGNTLDELVDGSSAHGYTTTGIPSDANNIDKLYERDWPGNDWPQSELTTRINNGLHVVDHLGHGSPDYAMKLYDYDVLNLLTNEDHCFVYSQTCLSGHFDDTDCWAEHMNIKTDYGAFAVIMNARYGFGEYNSTDGPSQRFNREFWDAVYRPIEQKPELGRANQDSKEDNLYRIDEDCMRWCYYELNLFGDPTVTFRQISSIAFDYPAGIPTVLTPGQPTSVEVVVSGLFDGEPVPSSGQLHYSIDGAAYVTIDMDEFPTNHYDAVLPALECGSTIEFYFTAEEASYGTFSDPRNAPTEVYSAIPAQEVFPDG
jgi:hypothetical protein